MPLLGNMPDRRNNIVKEIREIRDALSKSTTPEDINKIQRKLEDLERNIRRQNRPELGYGIM